MTRRLLLVDDDAAFLRIMKEAIGERMPGVRVLNAGNGKEALEVLEREQVDLVVTDLRMPVMSGCDFICELRKSQPDLPVLVMSSDVEPEDVQKLIGQSVRQFLEKSAALGQSAAVIIEALGEPAAAGAGV